MGIEVLRRKGGHMGVYLWKRVYTFAPDDPKVGLLLLDRMAEVEQALKDSQPEGVKMIEFTDGAIYFAGFIIHVEGGSEHEVVNWLNTTIQPWVNGAKRRASRT